MTLVPQDIQADRPNRMLQITWSDGSQSPVGFWLLRTECRCAGCVDERTGQRTLDPASVPRDVNLERMELVGNYAVRIHWSDGHNTGLYTWDRLHEVGQMPQ
jgi:DUF971 family protein